MCMCATNPNPIRRNTTYTTLYSYIQAVRSYSVCSELYQDYENSNIIIQEDSTFRLFIKLELILNILLNYLDCILYKISELVVSFFNQEILLLETIRWPFLFRISSQIINNACNIIIRSII